MTVLKMCLLALDPNGLPRGHHAARDMATTALRDLVNALPESVYFLNETDAEWVTDTMLTAYLGALKREQR